MGKYYGLNTNTDLGGNQPNDFQSPSQKATKTYIDGKTASLNYDNVVYLEADDTMSALMNNQDWYNVNFVLSSNASRIITVDNMASNENYIILSNSASTPITYTFDYSGLSQYIFIGDFEYASVNQKMYIEVPALSNMVFSFRPLNDVAIGYNVKRVRAAGSVDEENLENTTVALELKNTQTGELSYLGVDNYGEYSLDLSNYTIKPCIRVQRGKNGKPFVLHVNQTSGQWAVNNYYRLYCDTTANGGFTITVGNWETSNSWTVSWSAGDTLDSIKAKLTNATYVWFSKESGENFIRVSCYCSSASYNCTLTNNTGGSVDDLSKYCKVNGVQQAETHRVWQGTDVATLFPNSGFVPASTVMYAKNGYNRSYRTGCNLPKFKTWVNSSGGSATYVEESSLTKINETGFANLNGSGVAAEQALYDKYHGSWHEYMNASMVQLDDAHTNGMEYKSYDNGDTQNAFLASVTTMFFDGTYVPAYPAAYKASQITDVDHGAFHLPTIHELATIMDQATMEKINRAIAIIGSGTPLSNSGYYYWSVAQCDSSHSWFYNQVSGCLHDGTEYYTLPCRALAYIQ